MTLGVIYDLINYIVGKEWVGGTFTIPQLNNLLPMAQYDLLNAELEKVDAGELTPISGAVVGKSPLRPFYKSADLSIDIYGFATLPTDYLRWAGITTSDLRAIEVVSHQMFAERQSNVLRRADINPFGVLPTTSSVLCLTTLPLRYSLRLCRQSRCGTCGHPQHLITITAKILPLWNKSICPSGRTSLWFKPKTYCTT